MNVLLDECVPWPMHKLLPAHVCTTAQRRGWGGIKNGDLLRLAEGKFDLFINSNQNIRQVSGQDSKLKLKMFSFSRLGHKGKL